MRKSMEPVTQCKLILAFTVLLVVFMLWPIKSGELWIIDDHEIVYQAHQYKSLESANFFSRYTTVLMQTEVGNPDTSTRYRPVYYAVRTLKSALIGDNAKAWFSLNALYCLVGIASLGLALGRFFPWYITLPFMALTMALPFHRDLWSRLGPAEIDAFTYCMLFCLAVSRIREKGEKAGWAWPCCNIAVALSIGCKENFLLLLFPLAIITVYGLMQKSIQPRRLWWLAFPMLITYPVVRVVVRTIDIGHNIYVQDTSSQGLMSKALLFFSSTGFLICAVCLTMLLLLHAVMYIRIRRDFLRKLLPITLKQEDICYSLVAIITLAALVAGNFVFYTGQVPIGNRYAFPYYFLLSALALCPLYPLVPNIISGYASSLKFKSIVIIMAIVTIVAPSTLIYGNRQTIKNHMQFVSAFKNSLNEAKGYREIFLINAGQPIISYEPYYSLNRYATAGYLPCPVSYFPLFTEPDSEFHQMLEDDLRSTLLEQPPLTLANDVLLWQLDSGRLRIIEHTKDIRDISKLVTAYLQSSSDGLRLRIIEHTKDIRDISNLVTAYYLQSSSDGLTYITSPVIFYIPLDDPAITGMTLTGADENNFAAWRVSVNDQVIAEKNISYSQNTFTIKLPDMEPGDFLHPQLYKLSFVPKESAAPALRLRSLNLLR